MQKPLIFLALAIIVSAADDSKERRAIVNIHEGYQVSFPSTWYIWPVESTGTLGATSYPPEKAIEGGLTPAGHASITIAPAPSATRTIEEWADEDTIGTREVRRVHGGFQSDAQEVKRYLEVERADEVGPSVYYREVAVYFVFGGRMFRAQLEFKEGDTRVNV
jgi:hypothetical protein